MAKIILFDDEKCGAKQQIDWQIFEAKTTRNYEIIYHLTEMKKSGKIDICLQFENWRKLSRNFLFSRTHSVYGREKTVQNNQNYDHQTGEKAYANNQKPEKNLS